MNKNIKLVAIAATLIIAAAGVITFNACNKKNEVINSATQMAQNKGIVYQSEVPDREAYIIEFEKKLRSAAKSDEVLTVENANAFMFDILNFDFCNINGNGPDKTHETSTYTLNVSNGIINLDEFASLYSQISAHVYDYYHSLNLDNKNYYCIEPEIAEFDANATTTTVTVKSTLTSGLSYKNFTYDSTLCDYFTEYEYHWRAAADTLEKYFNMEFPRCPLDNSGRCFFSAKKPRTFDYKNYKFPGTNKPRLFYCGTCLDNTTIPTVHIFEDVRTMCDLLNDYIDLANDYSYGSCIMKCEITPMFGNRNNLEAEPIHHILKVDYSDIVCSTFEPRL